MAEQGMSFQFHSLLYRDLSPFLKPHLWHYFYAHPKDPELWKLQGTPVWCTDPKQLGTGS